MNLEWKVKSYVETKEKDMQKQRRFSNVHKYVRMYPWSSFELNDFWKGGDRWSKCKVELH